MALQVPQRQPMQRLVAHERRSGRYPRIEQHERRLLAMPRALADHALVCQPVQQVQAALSVAGDACRLHSRVQRRARHRRTARQRLFDHVATVRQRGRVEAEVACDACCVRGLHPRRQQRHHPAHVVAGQQVQRAPHRPGAHDLAARDGIFDLLPCRVFRAQTDRPQRGVVVLRLHRGQVSHGVRRCSRDRGADALGRQAACRQRRRHAYFSLRQLTEPRVSMVLDSTSTSKPLRSRYFSVTAEPEPTIDTP